MGNIKVRAFMGAVILFSVICPSRSMAEPDSYSGSAVAGLLAVVYCEPFFPDMRLEYDRRDHDGSVVFSWPVHWWFYRHDIHASVFVEPQIRYHDRDRRFLFGNRTLFPVSHPYCVITEAGGARGNGKFGAFVSLGFGAEDYFLSHGIVIRAVKTGKDIRVDLSYDIWSFNWGISG